MSARVRPRRSVLACRAQCARAGQGEGLPGRMLIFDLEDAVARQGGARRWCGAAGGRLRPARDDRARQRWPLGPGGSRRGSAAGRRRADPQGRERRCGAPGARAAGRRGRSCGSAAGAWRPRAPCCAPRKSPRRTRASPAWSWAPRIWPRSCAAHTPLRLPLLTALGLCLLAARACGLAILDGVHLDLEDDAGFAAACRRRNSASTARP